MSLETFKSLETDARRPTQGSVGILGPVRDQKCLHSALAAVAHVFGPQANLIISGGCDSSPATSQIVSQLGFVNVNFLTPAEMWLALSELEVLLVPAPERSIPATLLEAMGAGVPIIAAGVPHFSEFAEHGKSGFLVRGSTQEFQRWLEKLSENRELRDRVSRQARKNAIARFGQSLSTTCMSSEDRSATASRGFRKCIKDAVDTIVPSAMLRWRSKTRRNEIAVTFDDGPHPQYTPEVLRILSSYRIRATFFLLGNRAEESPEIVTRIADAGHEIANHSYSHPYFSKVTLERAKWEIREAERCVSGIGVPYHRIFRPPFGNFGHRSLLSPWLCSHSVVYWNVDLKDYRANHKSEIEALLAKTVLCAGDVILYHGVNSASIAALPSVIEAALGAGDRKCVTVSQLAAS